LISYITVVVVESGPGGQPAAAAAVPAAVIGILELGAVGPSLGAAPQGPAAQSIVLPGGLDAHANNP